MFETGTEKAAAALAKLTAARRELEGKAASAQVELATLRANAGEAELAAILEGVDVGPTRARAIALDLEISGLAGARTALMKRIAAAEKALQAAKAEAIRAEAGKIRKKLDAHVAESNRLRLALEKHEGDCPYIPRAEAIEALDAVTGVTGSILTWPASMRMQQEINGLLAQAAATEARKMEARGQVSGVDLTEILAAVGDNPLAPAEAELRQTFAEMEALAVAEWERHITGDFALGRGPAPDERETGYVIAFADGRVDKSHCTYQNSRRPERFDHNRPKAAPLPATGSFPDSPTRADYEAAVAAGKAW